MPAGTELSAQDKAVIALAFNNPTVGLNVVQWLEGIDSLSATELAYIDGVTAGTAAASKALVLNSSGGIATITSATITTLTSSSIISGAGNGAVGSSVAAVETGDGVTHKTVLTLDQDFTLTDAAEFITSLLYTFPAGRILVLGVTANAVMSRTDANIGATAEGDYSLGTTATSDKTLDGTDVNLLPSTAWIVASNEAPLTGALAASAQFDGTSTAVKMYLNLMIDTADISGDAAIGTSGTITITWINLGDY